MKREEGRGDGTSASPAGGRSGRGMNLYGLLFALIWTLLLAGLLAVDIRSAREYTRELALKEARANFNKDQAFRYWAASHGGVYVPATEKTPPNPYLKMLPERDITTPSGRQLTLMNPAYMVRQLNDYYREEYGIAGHITSLKLHRPNNAPDAWERASLEAFERGKEEVMEFTTMAGEPYLRLMKPMVTEKSCLKCHAYQGYREGDVRGGVGVALPLSDLLTDEKERISKLWLHHGAIWLVGLLGIVLSSRRLTHYVEERERVRQELEDSHEIFSTVMDSMEALVYVADMDTYELLFINEYGRVIFGDVAGKKCWEALQTGQSGVCSFCTNDKLVDGRGEPKGVYAWEFRNTVNGRWFDIRDRAIRWVDGRIVRMEIATDVTERKDAQAQLERYAARLEEANAMKDLFTDILRHDLLNPANVVTNYAELLLDREKDATKREMLGELMHNASRLTDMVKNAAKYAKLESMEKIDRSELDLGEILREVVHNFELKSEENGLRIINSAGGNYPVYGNRILEDIFSNLLSNAIKFSNPGGWIEISVFDEGSGWRIEVKDFGEGIAAGEKEKIFERFEGTDRRGVKGTGLGLAIAKRIVDLHGGRIGVEDNPEGGSLFYVTLPKMEG